MPDERDHYANAILRRLSDDLAIVPSIWMLEVANGLLVAERRGRLTAADMSQAHGILAGLPIKARDLSLDAALGPVLALARQENLSSYDASYLELAMREGVPLATVDDALRSAAGRVGVALAG